MYIIFEKKKRVSHFSNAPVRKFEKEGKNYFTFELKLSSQSIIHASTYKLLFFEFVINKMNCQG